jgi:hypothetical protein
MDAERGPPVQRQPLKHRDYEVDLDSRLGKTQVCKYPTIYFVHFSMLFLCYFNTSCCSSYFVNYFCPGFLASSFISIFVGSFSTIT